MTAFAGGRAFAAALEVTAGEGERTAAGGGERIAAGGGETAVEAEAIALGDAKEVATGLAAVVFAIVRFCDATTPAVGLASDELVAIVGDWRSGAAAEYAGWN